jgi:hypothetical protein
MSKPTNGKLIIDWKAVGPPNETTGQYEEFDWNLAMEPSGLSDDEVVAILSEIAERL